MKIILKNSVKEAKKSRTKRRAARDSRIAKSRDSQPPKSSNVTEPSTTDKTEVDTKPTEAPESNLNDPRLKLKVAQLRAAAVSAYKRLLNYDSDNFKSPEQSDGIASPTSLDDATKTISSLMSVDNENADRVLKSSTKDPNFKLDASNIDQITNSLNNWWKNQKEAPIDNATQPGTAAPSSGATEVTKILTPQEVTQVVSNNFSVPPGWKGTKEEYIELSNKMNDPSFKQKIQNTKDESERETLIQQQINSSFDQPNSTPLVKKFVDSLKNLFTRKAPKTAEAPEKVEPQVPSNVAAKGRTEPGVPSQIGQPANNQGAITQPGTPPTQTTSTQPAAKTPTTVPSPASSASSTATAPPSAGPKKPSTAPPVSPTATTVVGGGTKTTVPASTTGAAASSTTSSTKPPASKAPSAPPAPTGTSTPTTTAKPATGAAEKEFSVPSRLEPASKRPGSLGATAREIGATLDISKGQRGLAGDPAIRGQRSPDETQLITNLVNIHKKYNSKEGNSYEKAGIVPLERFNDNLDKIGFSFYKKTPTSGEFDDAVSAFKNMYKRVSREHRYGRLPTNAANDYINGLRLIAQLYKDTKLSKLSEVIGLRNRALNILLGELKPLPENEFGILKTQKGTDSTDSTDPSTGAASVSPGADEKTSKDLDTKAADAVAGDEKDKGAAAGAKAVPSDEELFALGMKNKDKLQKRFDVFKQNFNSVLGNLDNIIDRTFASYTPKDPNVPVSENKLFPLFEQKNGMFVLSEITADELKTSKKVQKDSAKLYGATAITTFKTNLKNKFKELLSKITLEDFLKGYITLAKTQLGKDELNKSLTSFRLLEAAPAPGRDSALGGVSLQAGARKEGFTALQGTEYKLIDSILRAKENKGLIDYTLQVFKDTNFSKSFKPEDLKNMERSIRSAFSAVSAGDVYKSTATASGGKEITGTGKTNLGGSGVKDKKDFTP